MAKGGSRLDLDHYLEGLIRKPGALPGATALEQARAAGRFTPVHHARWDAARKAHGDAAGTRALIEVLLLHRHMPHEHVVAGLATAVQAGALTADAVALEARKFAEIDDRPSTSAPGPRTLPANVISLIERRLAQLPADTRPLPTGHRLRPAPATPRGRNGIMTSRHRGLTEQAADAAVDSACRLLRLPTIRSQFTACTKEAPLRSNRRLRSTTSAQLEGHDIER
jgi:hypothetical protein